jgi:16S rRNA (guanine966-N2)-methyltransferase
MRVISGTLKGRRLMAPTGMAIRPTADRIKESVFNILAGSVQTKRTLDLFAGTGALGIEALSRGAASAVFVDQAKAALAAIRRNIRELGLEDRSHVIHWNILKNLNCLIPERDAFDLVFMDPPYATDAVSPVLAGLLSCGALAAGARVIIEHSSREPIVLPMGILVLSDQRRFGKTLVSFIDSML